METQEYIDSGILELYVFGILDEVETKEVSEMAAKNDEIKSEILSIEKAIISLSFSMSPYLSASNFDTIRNQLLTKHQGVIDLKPKSNALSYLGWAAAVLLLVGTGYFYNKNQIAEGQIVAIETEKKKLNTDFNILQIKNQQTEVVLAVIRDENNLVVPLGGQAVAPTAKAKIYWNKTTEIVYVDASGLPEPPDGMVYQIWSLKLNPLTPTSIGLLAEFRSNDAKLFKVEKTTGAEAFGITLEPAGGSVSPTMEQLYTLGVVKV